MVFAVPTDEPFILTEPVKPKKISEEQKRIFEWCNTHRVEVHIDPVTGEIETKVFDRNDSKGNRAAKRRNAKKD